MTLQTKKKSWIAAYSIPALLIMCLLYTFVWMTGRSLFMGSDGFTMQYTATMYFKEFWSNAFAGNFLHMDFTVGEGLSPMLTMAYYGLTDPMNALFCFVTDDNVFILYAINMLIRWFLCGFCAALYLKRHTSDVKVIATGALIYAFSGFMLIWQFCPAVLATGYLFPLLLLTFEKAMTEKKYLGFVFVSALAYLTNYYTAILMSMAIFVYAVLWIVHNWKNSKRVAKENVLTYVHTAMAHATGLMLTAWMLVPMIIYFTNGTRTDAAHTFSWLYYDPKYYFDALVGMFTANAGATAFFTQTPKLMISCSPLLIPVLIATFKNKQHNIKSVGITIMCILLACIPLFAEITSLTGYPVHRWTFVMSLVLCVCYVKHMETVERLNVKHRLIACVLIIACAIGTFWTIQPAAAVINIVMAVIACIATLRPSVKGFYRATCLICALLVFSWVLGAENISNYMFRGVWSDPQYNLIETHQEYISDNGINNRLSWIGHTGNTNSGTLQGVYTNHISWNSLPAGANEYNEHTQQYPTLLASYWPTSYNGRASSYMLGSSKYFIAQTGAEAPYGFEVLATGEDFTVWQNKYQTSVGYGFTQCMSKQQFDTLDIAQKQIALMRYAIVDTECAEIEMPNFELPATKTENGYILNVPANTELYISCEARAVENVYELLVKGPDWWSRYPEELKYNDAIAVITASNGDKQTTAKLQIKHPDAYPSYYAPNRTVCLGCNVTGDVTVIMNHSDILDITDVRFFALPVSEYDEAMEALQTNLLTNATVSNNMLTGVLHAEKDMILQVAVPYQDGWKAYIDGVETEIFASGVQYIGLEVSAGTHNIELRYIEPGFEAGVIITSTGALLTASSVAILIYKRRKKVALN